MNIKVPTVGYESFEGIIKNNLCYIDKTSFLVNLFEAGNPNSIYASPVLLFNRPRRFGKSLNLSTLYHFLNIGKDNRELFAGLEIMKHPELIDKWMNKWPVLVLSFKAFEAYSPELAETSFRDMAVAALSSYRFLLDSPKVSLIERSYLKRLAENLLADAELPFFASKLCSALSQHYDKKVVVIIDEYDVPLARTAGTEHYEKMLAFMRLTLDFLKGDLKGDSPCLAAILTGCLRLAGESLFTGLNNFICFGVNDEAYASAFGFTGIEVKELLKSYNLGEFYQEIEEWYDGYLIGSTRIFCPWDVMNYAADKIRNRNSEPKKYWLNTSSAEFIQDNLQKIDRLIKGDLETLFAGGVVAARYNENMTYSSLAASPDNFWTLLYSTGYLTVKEGVNLPSGFLPLGIPNREIKEIFVELADGILRRKVEAADIEPFYQAFFTKDADEVSVRISKLLRESISYFYYKEYFYHAFVLGLFAPLTGIKLSNYEHGLGRPDIIIQNQDHNVVLIIEIKYVKKPDLMPAALSAALKQIAERNYAEPYQEEWNVVECALVFSRKQCSAAFR